MKTALLGYFQDGRHYAGKGTGFTDAYFVNPAHIEGFMSLFQLETLTIATVEGLGAATEEKLMQLEEKDFQSWLDVFETICSNREIWGSGHHLLYIGRAWKR